MGNGQNKLQWCMACHTACMAPSKVAATRQMQGCFSTFSRAHGPAPQYPNKMLQSTHSCGHPVLTAIGKDMPADVPSRADNLVRCMEDCTPCMSDMQHSKQDVAQVFGLPTNVLGKKYQHALRYELQHARDSLLSNQPLCTSTGPSGKHAACCVQCICYFGTVNSRAGLCGCKPHKGNTVNGNC